MTPADRSPRRSMGGARLLIVVGLLIAIAIAEIDWLTTPWWVLAMQICGTGHINGAVGDLIARIWNML